MKADAEDVRRVPAELWFRGVSARDIRQGRVRATVRLGRRNHTHPRGYVVGERVVIRCFTWDNVEIAVLRGCIAELQMKAFAVVQTCDLEACAMNECTRAKLEQHLTACYQRAIEPTAIVTIVRFTYNGGTA